MAEITIWHNPNCSTSRFAVETAGQLGMEVDERRYLNQSERPGRDEIVALLSVLEDPATDLVRRDANFERLGLGEHDVATAEQVADVLARHPELLQRPVLVRDGRAIIGRPKDRIAPFLTGA
jgi:arsenate reductase (glutaredoxin)